MAWFIAPLVYVALVGLHLSAVAHVCGLLGLPQPLGGATWTLHLGIFLVLLPAAIVGQREGTSEGQASDFPGCPAWYQRLVGALFIYAVVNFAAGFVMLHLAGRPTGGPADEVPPVTWRMFSGHWMVFYAVAAGMLESALVRARQGSSAGLAGDAKGKPDD